MLFRSAINLWCYFAVILCPVLLVRAAVPVVTGANSTIVSLVIAAIAPLIILPAWILFSTYYRIDSAILRVQSGPFTWAVPLEQIHTVTVQHSYTLAPALSFHRLEIVYGRDQRIVVSPRHKVAFLEALGLSPAAVLQPSRQRPNPFALGEKY